MRRARLDAARIDGGVDARQTPVGGHQRAAAVAGIDGRVGLDEKLIVAGRQLGARQGRNDAHGHGLADAERIAHRQHQVAHLHLVAVGEGHHRQPLALGVDLQHRQVGTGVGQQHLGLELAPVVERHGDLGAAFHHMVVGEDQTVGAHDHAAAQAALDALAQLGIAEKLRKQRIAEEGIGGDLGDAGGIDVHHRGRDPAHHRGKGQLHMPHRCGRGRLGAGRRGRGGRQPQGRLGLVLRESGNGERQGGKQRGGAHAQRHGLHKAQPSDSLKPAHLPNYSWPEAQLRYLRILARTGSCRVTLQVAATARATVAISSFMARAL